MNIKPIFDRLARSTVGPPMVPKQRRQRMMLHHSKGQGSPWALADYCVNDRGWDCHPYTFHDHGGQMYQTAPLNDVTPHAMTYSRSASSPVAYGIVITGNFDELEPPAGAFTRAATVCALLSIYHDWGSPSQFVEYPSGIIAPRCSGHREVPWSSRKVDRSGIVLKTCPGDRFSMTKFRHLVSDIIGNLPADLDITEKMTEAGIIIPKEKSWKV